MHAKSASLLHSLEGGLPRIMTWWFVAAMLGSALRIAVSPLHGAPSLETYLPYVLLVTAPLLSMALALHVVLLGSLYTIAFVAALRRVPLFPRLLVAIWMIDLAMQLAIAGAVARTEGLPPTVADALHTLLDGNVKKVMVSVILWLP